VTPFKCPSHLRSDKIAGLALVVALHAGAFWALWQQGLMPSAEQAKTLFVTFMQPPPVPPKPEPPKPLPQPVKPRPMEKPLPQQLVSQAPVLEPTEALAPAPVPLAAVLDAAPVAKAAPVAIAPPAPPPNKPVVMESELSVACPNREPPVYPAQARRRGESGTVVLKVELDERGHVADARIQTSSGQTRLDEAALSAVRNWRCTPPSRNGVAVRAIALQPFNFVLQGM
jgi:protein TonB